MLEEGKSLEKEAESVCRVKGVVEDEKKFVQIAKDGRNSQKGAKRIGSNKKEMLKVSGGRRYIVQGGSLLNNELLQSDAVTKELQLENKLMTYLKACRRKRSMLIYRTRNFEEIQVLLSKLKGTKKKEWSCEDDCSKEAKDPQQMMIVMMNTENVKDCNLKMLDLGLEVEEESTAALHLSKDIRIDSPEANGFWLSIHLVVYNEELAIPEQTATGKGISNPLMAGSLPKTTKPT
ncbi:hypothetical protein Tco_0190601 [Tanacetum coccineum]